MNGDLTRTPVLDQLMDESILLDNHYTSSPVCFPTRASLMSGMYPQRVGAVDLPQHRPYQHLGIGVHHPTKPGFDEAAGLCFGLMDYFDWRLDYNDLKVKSDGRYLTDVFPEEAVDYITRHRKEPFFLHLAYNAPHTPLQAPDDDVSEFQEKGMFTKAVSTLYGMNYAMDRGIGRVLEKLAELGIADYTLIFFTSDNGPALGGTGEACQERLNCNLRGGKTKVYEKGIRWPMMV